VVDVRDGRDKADGVDAGGVRKSRGGIDERQSSDRGPVEPKEIERFVGAINVRSGAERGSRRLHLDDHRQKSERVGLHARAECGIDLGGDIR